MRRLWLGPRDRRAPPGGTGGSRLALDLSLDTLTLRSGSFDADATVAPVGAIHDPGLHMRMSTGWSRYEYLVSDSPRSVGSGRGRDTCVLVGFGMAVQRAGIIAHVGPACGQSLGQGLRRSANGTKAVFSIYGRPKQRSMVYASQMHNMIQSST